jgi:hypothetical protein
MSGSIPDDNDILNENIQIPKKRKEFPGIIQKFGPTSSSLIENTESSKFGDAIYALATGISFKSQKQFNTTEFELMILEFTGLEAEVNNGGFHQYFFNSTGNSWEKVYSLLKMLPQSNGILRFDQVISIFPNSYPNPNREKRWKQLEEIENVNPDAMWSHFDKCDSEYYNDPFPSYENVWNLINIHKQDIDVNFELLSNYE